MLELVERNDVTVVSTSTGSGKSTLMPLLLLADPKCAYNRIAVTQPRRLAVQSIHSKIQELHGPNICGYAMAGEKHNLKAPVVYITDGLVRRMIRMNLRFDIDVIIIDEVHERSLEIDTCIALLAFAKANNFLSNFQRLYYLQQLLTKALWCP